MTLLFLISGSVLLLYELLSGILMLFHRDPPPSSSPPISVLLPSHDEREKLEANLPRIFEAMNEGDELVLVDDGSSDGTYESLLEHFPDHPILIVRNYVRQGKKKAVALGASRATHSYILQTDADCRPRSPEWIDRMRGAARRGAELGLGWGAIEGKGGILDALLRYETARTAIGYSSFALLGSPYMGVGRNLLYKKTLRTAREMPEAYYRTMSGDDDLLVAYRGKGSRCTSIHHPSSHTLSPAPSSWKDHWTRSRRQVEAGRLYPLRTLIPLGILRIAELLFILSSIVLLFTPSYDLALTGYPGMMILRGTVLTIFSKPLGPIHLALSTPFLAFISSMSRTFVELSVIVSKPARWR
jgi:glycosyltransferase involved in cell wall biosynthesis